MNKVLCVMDKGPTLDAVRRTLEVIGLEGLSYPTDRQALASLTEPGLSAVLLDASADPKRVPALVQQIHKLTDIPILVIIKAGQDDELPALLDAGTDDFVMSPIRSEELTLRLQVLLMRTAQNSGKDSREILTCQELLLDIKDHRVWKNGAQIVLSPMGFSLLTYLLTHQGQVVTKSQLMQDVWGYSNPIENANLVEIGIARLRRELGENPKNPEYLHTVWGKGYRFEFCRSEDLIDPTANSTGANI